MYPHSLQIPVGTPNNTATLAVALLFGISTRVSVAWHAVAADPVKRDRRGRAVERP